MDAAVGCIITSLDDSKAVLCFRAARGCPKTEIPVLIPGDAFFADLAAILQPIEAHHIYLLVPNPHLIIREGFKERLHQVLFSKIEKATLIVPLIDDITFWEALRGLRSAKIGICLFLSRIQKEGSVTVNVAFYKTLNIDAVFLAESVFENGLVGLGRSYEDQLSQLLEAKKMPYVVVNDGSQFGERLHYIHSLVKRVRKQLRFCDIFIEPLQPLRDNLGLGVYEIFEQDTTKYAQYGNALQLAVEDLLARNRAIDILVVGPGRGPLIALARSACLEVGTEYTITAVEKNPECIGLLQQQNSKNWSGEVAIIQADIRELENTHYDLVVSELLGSFGCNELCPEILELFVREDVVMIPQRYSSFLEPIYSPLIDELPQEKLQQPFLINLSSFYSTAKPVKVFDFEHPSSIGSSREVSLEFESIATINALQGYFTADLYGHFQIGTLPGLSEDEHCGKSWYPIIFPIVPIKGTIRVVFKRIVSDKRVWYEWSVNETKFNEDGWRCAMER